MIALVHNVNFVFRIAGDSLHFVVNLPAAFEHNDQRVVELAIAFAWGADCLDGETIFYNCVDLEPAIHSITSEQPAIVHESYGVRLVELFDHRTLRATENEIRLNDTEVFGAGAGNWRKKL